MVLATEGDDQRTTRRLAHQLHRALDSQRACDGVLNAVEAAWRDVDEQLLQLVHRSALHPAAICMPWRSHALSMAALIRGGVGPNGDDPHADMWSAKVLPSTSTIKRPRLAASTNGTMCGRPWPP